MRDVQLICFEGLSPFLIGTPNYVKRGLLDKLDKRPDLNVWRGSFMSRGPQKVNPADKHILLGHSMGGPTAIWWCNQHPGLEIDLLLTLDPRPLHQPYVKPANVKRCVNFYQTGFMRGYPVEGAENHHVKIRHTLVPRLALELLKGEL